MNVIQNYKGPRQAVVAEALAKLFPQKPGKAKRAPPARVHARLPALHLTEHVIDAKHTLVEEMHDARVVLTVDNAVPGRVTVLQQAANVRVQPGPAKRVHPVAGVMLWGAPEILHATHAGGPPTALTLRTLCSLDGAHYEQRGGCEAAEGMPAADLAARTVYVTTAGHRTAGDAAVEARSADHTACIQRTLDALRKETDVAPPMHLMEGFDALVARAGLPPITPKRKTYTTKGDQPIDTAALFHVFSQLAHLLERDGVPRSHIVAVFKHDDDDLDALVAEHDAARKEGMLLVYAQTMAKLFLARPAVLKEARATAKHTARAVESGESWVHGDIDIRWQEVADISQGTSVDGEAWTIDGTHRVVLKADDVHAYTTYAPTAEMAVPRAWQAHIEGGHMPRRVLCEAVVGGERSGKLKIHLRVPLRIVYLVTDNE